MKDLLPTILDTKDKSSIVAAINELVAKIGPQDLTALNTVAKDSLINAINELVAKSGEGGALDEIDAVIDLINEHTGNSGVHVTQAEKNAWTNKSSVSIGTTKPTTELWYKVVG